MTSFADRALRKLKKILGKEEDRSIPFAELFKRFQCIVHANNAALQLIADMDGKQGGDFVFDRKYLSDCVQEIKKLALSGAHDLNFITGNKFLGLYDIIEGLASELETELSGRVGIHHEARRVLHMHEVEEGDEDVVGHKAYNLSRLMQLPGLNIPKGFVAGVACFRDYLAYNNLFDEIANLIEACQKGEKSVASTSSAIQLLILAGDIPPRLRREVMAAAREICDDKTDSARFAVRSSAIGEDGDFSFAGIHDSFLNVRYSELLPVYKRVLASLYSPADLSYRLKMSLFFMEMAMPVLFEPMIPGKTAGVLYTLDPNQPDRMECIVSATRGLGEAVVAGRDEVDTFRVSRHPPHGLIHQQIARKSPATNAAGEDNPPDAPNRPQEDASLTPAEIVSIVETGLILERFFKKPLDVEWSIDRGERLWILQARQLKIVRKQRLPKPQYREKLKNHRILLKDKGMIAYRGIGTGPVYLVTDSEKDLSDFPTGAVLVSREAQPRLAEVIPKAGAVITDIGTTTGHMATVAREFRVPTIVGTSEGTRRLRHGQVVTVDAEKKVVYEGRVEALVHHQLLDEPVFEKTAEFQLLRRLLKKIAPLSLTDPNAPEFTPRGCRTFHDVFRFVHEKAFQTLTRAGANPRICMQRGGRRLKSPILMDLILIDLGGGIDDSAENQVEVNPGQIRSTPMKAIWEGLSAPDVWNVNPVTVDFRGFMSSITRTQSEKGLAHSQPRINLGVIGGNYVYLSLPLGYHFTAVEAGIGDKTENNYISFRFSGGVTDITRRSRRAKLLASILEKSGFKVNVSRDLVNARAIDLTSDQIIASLQLIGRLIGFTRQLDVLLKSDTDIDEYFDRFMKQAEKLERGALSEGPPSPEPRVPTAAGNGPAATPGGAGMKNKRLS